MTGVAHMPDVQKFFIKVRNVLKLPFPDWTLDGDFRP
jgi:hypothetical protein